MGVPPDGFEYKWEWQDKEQYKSKKNALAVTDDSLSELSNDLVQLAGQLQQVTTQSASQNATGNALETEREKHRQEIEQLKEKHQQEIAEAREEAAKRAKREGRNDTIRQIYSHLKDLNESDRQSIKRAGGISQRLLGDAVELSQQQIGNIIRETNRAD